MIKSNISLEKSYELFGLKPSASIDNIKKIYRQIAKKIHPDLNPHDPNAQDRFNTLNQAYKLLLETAQTATNHLNRDTDSIDSTSNGTSVRVELVVDSALFPKDLLLKQEVFESLEKLIRQGNFTKAIAIVDTLDRVIPNCPEISRKQSEVYFQYAQDLVKQRSQLKLARTYLKESLRIDPHNQQRWEAVNREFNRIERMLK